ncbi:hypothetical protein NEUTE2DRAFT_132295 [Neurospora tetrasperma FGSC 2509]|nr:hypothetical protein NEUTE2DRAFT_132295 [Neurospora tetrasperma FGSC 2509]
MWPVPDSNRYLPLYHNTASSKAIRQDRPAGESWDEELPRSQRPAGQRVWKDDRQEQQAPSELSSNKSELHTHARSQL